MDDPGCDAWGFAKVWALARSMREERDLVGSVLLVSIAVTLAVALTVPFSARLEAFLIARHQVTLGVSGHLAALAYPSMYSFEHRRFASVRGFPPQDADSSWPQSIDGEACGPGRWWAENHFPGRWPYGFTGLAKSCGAEHVYLEIRSRGLFGEYRSRGILYVPADGPPRWQVP